MAEALQQQLPWDQIQKMGQAALAKGVISPEEAQANQDQVTSQMANPAPIPGVTLANGERKDLASLGAPPMGANTGGKISPYEFLLQDKHPETLSTDQLDNLSTWWDNSSQGKSLNQGIKDQQDLLAMESKKQAPVDFRPIAALVDAQTGSKLAASLPAPPDINKQRHDILDYSNKLQQDKRDAFLGLVKAVHGSTGGNFEELVKSMSPKDSSSSDARNILRLGAYTEHYIKPLEEDLLNIHKGISLLSNNSGINQFIAMDATLKAAIGGRLSNFDIVRQGSGNKAFDDRLGQAIETFMTGKLTPDNRGQYLLAMKTIEQAVQKEKERRISQGHDLGAAMDISDPKLNLVMRGFHSPDQPVTGNAGTDLKNVRKSSADKAQPGAKVSVVNAKTGMRLNVDSSASAKFLKEHPDFQVSK